jgi:signal peptidase I
MVASATGTVLGAAGLAFVWIVRRRLVAVTVRGVSMEPSFRPGDRVLVLRIPPARLRRTDVVVVSASPGQCAPFTAVGSTRWLLKRVAALPGHAVPDAARSAVPTTTVPDGQLILLGDNMAMSIDSRVAGFYPVERVLGRVVRRLSG